MTKLICDVKRKSIRAFIVTWLLFVPAVVIADPIDNYLQCEMKKLKIPGLSIAIVKNGQIVKTKGYGFSNIELQSPASPETVYQSGSIGKQFTAMLVMMLVEKGILRLDDHINQYLKVKSTFWKDITIRHLLTHTSGLSRYWLETDVRLDYSNDELLKRLSYYPLNFKPGEKWEYCNTGYDILGIIIQNVTGIFYGDLLQKNIFKPLNMNTAFVNNDINIIPNRAAGYNLDAHGIIKNKFFTSPTFSSQADGALSFSVLDLAKWDEALYTTKLLQQNNMKLLWSPVGLNDGSIKNYGFGWDLGTNNGHHVIEHGGELDGFTAFISRYVDDQLTVIIMTNLSGNAELRAITHRVASIYDNEIKVAKDEASDNSCAAIK